MLKKQMIVLCLLFSKLGQAAQLAIIQEQPQINEFAIGSESAPLLVTVAQRQSVEPTLCAKRVWPLAIWAQDVACCRCLDEAWGVLRYPASATFGAAIITFGVLPLNFPISGPLRFLLLAGSYYGVSASKLKCPCNYTQQDVIDCREKLQEDCSKVESYCC